MMAQAFARMDILTREEFDVQAQLLERALNRIAALESRVQALEGRPDTPLQTGSSTGVPPVDTP